MASTRTLLLNCVFVCSMIGALYLLWSSHRIMQEGFYVTCFPDGSCEKEEVFPEGFLRIGQAPRAFLSLALMIFPMILGMVAR